MNCKQSFLFTCFFVSTCFYSQNSWYRYKWTVENSLNPKILCEEAYSFDLKHYQENTFVNTNYKIFSRESVLYLYEDLVNGRIYRSFEGKEEYIRKVLNTIVKDTAVTNSIKIFFYRDESINASMSESGVLRLNVGMMARLNNEAELAMLLGHEVAHFVNEDVAKSYARSKENKRWNGDWEFGGLKWNWYGGISVRLTYNPWYSREQEEAADFTSTQFLKKSSYSLKSGGNLYRIFKRDEIRDEIKYGKLARSQRTHPDPGERMKMVKNFLEDSLNRGKRNFIVDSLEFLKVKEMCFMESVNIGLQKNNLEDVVTLTFSRYLLEPDNENNLSVLIEALRRYILLNEESKIDKKSFILYPYQNKKQEGLTNYPFLREETPSILNYLSKGFVDIWKEDLKAIKATELTDPAVIEFTTVGEAYNYFKRKALENKFRIAEHYQYFGPEADFKDLASYQKINTLFLSNAYLARKKEDTAQKKLIVMLPFSTNALLSTFELDSLLIKTEQFNANLSQYTSIKQSNKVSKLSDFSFCDQRLMLDLANFCRSEFKTDSETDPVYGTSAVVKSKRNWADIYPEFYNLFSKNNITELYMCVPRVPADESENKHPRVTMYYYKIVLPSKNKTNLFANRGDWSIGDLKDASGFFKGINRELNLFIKKSEKD